MGRIEQSVEVNGSVHAVYEYLNRVEEYANFLPEVQVRRSGTQRMHWHVHSGAQETEWEMEITQQLPGQRLAWRNVDGPRYSGQAELESIGVARTRLKIVVESPPDAQFLAEQGNAQAALQSRIRRGLVNFKQHVERHQEYRPDEAVQTEGSVLRVAVVAPGAPQDAELIGKTIGQTAVERDESEHSVSKGRGSGASAHASSLPRFLDWQQPFRLMRRVSHDMQQVFDSVVGRDIGAPGRVPERSQARAWSPTVETAQREHKFIVCAELPGVKRNDVRVQVRHDRITIEGDRFPEPQHEPLEQRRSERSYGHFYRVVSLPMGADLDAASASMHDGMLEISVPISPRAQDARELEVRGD
jgi:HSP20 family molecular chaperone IbpA